MQAERSAYATGNVTRVSGALSCTRNWKSDPCGRSAGVAHAFEKATHMGGPLTCTSGLACNLRLP